MAKYILKVSTGAGAPREEEADITPEEFEKYENGLLDKEKENELSGRAIEMANFEWWIEKEE